LKYKVTLETRARDELYDLPKDVVRRVISVLEDLENNPRPSGSKKLMAQEGYRIRRGDYRILYTIDDVGKLVHIYRIGHRCEIYR